MRSKWLLALWLAFAPVAAQAFPEVQAVKASGVSVWVAEDSTLPIVSVVFTFRGAGNISDPADKEGRAAFAASMLTQGAGEYDALAFSRALAERAIRLSVRADADALVVRLKCLREFLPDAIGLLRTALVHPAFDAQELATARAQQLSTLRSLDASAEFQASQQLQQTLYRGHPYGQHALGTPDSVNALSADDLRLYQQTFLTRANLQVAAAGAIGADDMAQLLRPLVRALPEGLGNAAKAAQASLQGLGSTVRHAMPLPQSVVAFALPWVARSDKDFYAAYVAQIIYGGTSLTSYLSSEIRRKGGLVYDISTQIDLRDGASVLLGYAGTRNASVDEVIARVRNVTQQLADKGVSQQQCDDAKEYVIGGLPLQLDSTEAFAAMVALMQRDNLGTDYMQKRAELFGAVSCAEVNAAAKRLLSPDKILFSVAGGSAEGGQ